METPQVHLKRGRPTINLESQQAVRKLATSLQHAAASLELAAQAVNTLFAPLLTDEAPPVEEEAQENFTLNLW